MTPNLHSRGWGGGRAQTEKSGRGQTTEDDSGLDSVFHPSFTRVKRTWMQGRAKEIASLPSRDGRRQKIEKGESRGKGEMDGSR